MAVIGIDYHPSFRWIVSCDTRFLLFNLLNLLVSYLWLSH
jgi:hypothetical protein